MHTHRLAKIGSAAAAAVIGLVGSGLVFTAAEAATGYASTGPTATSAFAADQELAIAIRNNDANGIEDLLSTDWAVVATSGGMGEGKSVFPDGIKSGALVRKTYELSDARVRLYGNVALVTSKVRTSGMFGGRPFDVTERQTDVLLWKGGSWKCVLTQETKIDVPKAT